VSDGDTPNIKTPVTNNGIIEDDSAATFGGAINGTGIISLASDAAVTFDGAVASGQTIVLDDGLIGLGDPDDFAGTIDNFGFNDVLELPNETVSNPSYNGHQLTFNDASGNQVAINIGSGDGTFQNPLEIPDGSGGFYLAPTDTDALFSATVTTGTFVPAGVINYGAQVGAGGSVDVQTGGEMSNATVSSGGTVTVEANASFVAGSVDGGLLDIRSGGTAASVGINDGGLVHLELDTTTDGTILFGSGGGTLQIDDTNMPTATITGFWGGDIIDLTGIPFDPSGAAVLQANNLLQITENGASYDLQLDPSQIYTGETFELSPDGTQITLEPACFLHGTHIVTDCGEVPVEQLRAGDLVHTGSGQERPIRWIGHRRVDCARHPTPGLVWPVRIIAGAFGPDLPRRDLLLSPDHAVFAAGVLIPVKHLANGRTVRQEPAAGVHYFHIELGTHDVILAEGLSVETYLDTGDRGCLDNAGQPLSLHPDFSARRLGIAALWEGLGYAPLMVTGRSGGRRESCCCNARTQRRPPAAASARLRDGSR